MELANGLTETTTYGVNTSNVISSRLNNFIIPGLMELANGLTETTTYGVNTSNVISTRINNLVPYNDTNVVYNIALLSSQYATLLQNIQNAKSINVVYERQQNSIWTAVEGNNVQMLVEATVVIRLKPSSFFPTNTVAPYTVSVRNTKTTNNTTTNTTTVFNNTAITNIFTLQYSGMTAHNILITITSNDGFVSPNFIFRIRSFANLFG